MSDGPSPFSDPPGSILPDRPLVVKCIHNTRHSKLTFRSARNCTYDGLQEKITKHFSLTVPFTIQWQDDEKDWHMIEDELSLIDAIDFFQTGTEEGSVASSSSVFASRSSSRHPKITVLVEIFVEYDSLSLSETSSVREEDSPEGSQVSFLPGELSSSTQDDDAVTVSSKDTHAPRAKAKADSSLLKKFLNGTSRSAGSSRSRIFNLGSRTSSTEEETTTGSVWRSSGSLTDSYPDDRLAVFERLKLEEQRSPPSVHDRPILETDRGRAWLQNQSTMQKAILGVVPSTSDDRSSINESPFSDVNSDMGIELQRDKRGKLYYNLTSFGSTESAGDLEYEVVNGTQPNNATNHLHELLVPEVVTDCSECGIVLDQFKYICTTCGEKTPMSRTALAAAAAAVGKGKCRASPSPGYHHSGNSTEYELQEPSYPPRAHRDPVSLYTPSNTNMPIYSSNSKPLPALPSHSPTQTIFGKSFGSQSTLVPSSSSGSSSPTTRVGYELCHTCFEKVGCDHALPARLDSPKLPPTPQELAIARRSAPKRKGDLRHAFLFQIWGAGFDGWQDVEQNNMSDHCSGCQSQLSGNWYKCGKCDDFTICLACYNEVHNVHPIHPFLVKPPCRSNSRPERSNGDGARMFDNSDEPLKHPGVQCVNCQQDIVGPLFHCVDCTTIDIDICSNCETAGLPGNLDASEGGHNSSHIMLKIPMPLTKPEVQHVSRHAHGLHHGRDHTDLRGGVSPMMRSSPSSVSSISPGTVLYSNESGTEIGEDYVHLKVCNSCVEPIVGTRYQCLNCPSKPNSFNLCSDCELKSYKVHNPMHVFIKIPRPVDYPGPLESEFSIIPVLYRDPAGPAPGSPAAEISGDPAAYLRDLTHTFALCDRHLLRIVGKWYRCAFCAKDLCADCEELDTHDNTHIFLVFKAPVDMEKFRDFADLDNPNGRPVITDAIYRP